MQSRENTAKHNYNAQTNILAGTGRYAKERQYVKQGSNNKCTDCTANYIVENTGEGACDQHNSQRFENTA